MAEIKEIKIRQSQALFPMGVGAILNYQGQSFIACDIDLWRGGVEIHEERLESFLGIKSFKMPPAFNDKRSFEGVPFARFPRWLFCQNNRCRKLQYLWLTDETGQHPVCKECGGKLYPMRFVLACESGHLADFPWDWWAHRNQTRRCEKQKDKLRFKIKPGETDGSLASLIVECGHCKQSNDLSQIPHLKLPCPGTHPWRNNETPQDCSARTRVLQRGASNLRYDYTAEAISIPPYSDFDYWSSDSHRIMTHMFFRKLVDECKDFEIPRCAFFIEEIAKDLDITEESVRRAVLAVQGEPTSSKVDDLEFGEYEALTSPDREHDPRDQFQKRRSKLNEYIESLPDSPENQPIKHAAQFIASIHIINRLRVVRALTGFSRILRDQSCKVPVDLGKRLNWKPAVEYFGEGIFIDFDTERFLQWAESAPPLGRAERLSRKIANLPISFRSTFPGGSYFQPIPQFLFLHTFAHALMLKLQFYAGYSSSAIRERIYCSFPGMENSMYGIMIFTSAGDVEGSMGGLAKMGLPENIMPLIVDTLEDSCNCSYDPVCYESAGQGIDGLNLAACHACALVPETACICRNQFLDRAMLIDPQAGLFAGIARR